MENRKKNSNKTNNSNKRNNSETNNNVTFDSGININKTINNETKNIETNKKATIASLIFILIIGIGTTAICVGAFKGKTYSELEKRELKKFPEFQWAKILDGSFEKEFEEAVADHIFGRDEFVTAKTHLQIALGKRTVDNTYIDGDRLIELYNERDFDEKQINENVKNVADFLLAAADNIGHDHVKMVLVPSKSEIYEEEIPKGIVNLKYQYELAERIKSSLSKERKSINVNDDESAADSSQTEDLTDESEITDDIDSEFDFDEGDPDAEEEFNFDEGDPDTEEGFNFDEGDPDAEEGFNFDEGDPDTEEGFNFDEGDPDAEEGFNFDEGDPDAGKSDFNDSSAKSGDSSAKSGDGFDKSGDEGEVNSDEDKPDVGDASEFDDMILDLSKDLKSHKSEYIYYLTDHHWTTLGAKYAYNSIVNSFSKKERAENEKMNDEGVDDGKAGENDKLFSKETITDSFLGSDYNRIHFREKEDSIERYKLPEGDTAKITVNDSGEIFEKDSIYDETAINTADKYNYFLGGNYSSITIETTSKSDKTLFIIKDSYANSLIPFLCANYKKIIMVDPRYVSTGVLDYIPENAKLDDIIVLYNKEKFMQDTHQMYLG